MRGGVKCVNKGRGGGGVRWVNETMVKVEVMVGGGGEEEEGRRRRGGGGEEEEERRRRRRRRRKGLFVTSRSQDLGVGGDAEDVGGGGRVVGRESLIVVAPCGEGWRRG